MPSAFARPVLRLGLAAALVAALSAVRASVRRVSRPASAERVPLLLEGRGCDGSPDLSLRLIDQP